MPRIAAMNDGLTTEAFRARLLRCCGFFALAVVASVAVSPSAVSPAFAADEAPKKAEPKKAPPAPSTTPVKRKGLPPHPLAAIPFEDQRASERRDKTYIHINQDVTQVPGHRVESLPIVNGKVGEHANLDGDVEIYFPYGRILRATTQFEKYRAATQADGKPQVNPRYTYVNMFDHALGPVCATGEAASSNGGKGRIELRINRENAISFVRTFEPSVRGPENDKADGYKVVTALDIRNITLDEPEADHLYRSCMSGNRKSAALSSAPDKK